MKALLGDARQEIWECDLMSLGRVLTLVNTDVFPKYYRMSCDMIVRSMSYKVTL